MCYLCMVQSEFFGDDLRLVNDEEKLHGWSEQDTNVQVFRSNG